MRPFFRDQNLFSALLLGGLLLICSLLSACAMVDYLPPDQGTSAELQSLLAKSLEGNMKEIPFDPSGKVVDLQVKSFGPYKNPVGLEGYVKSLFREWIIGQGGRIGPGQLRMDVLLPVLGNAVTRRDLSYQNIPLYYSERFEATTRLVVIIRDSKGAVVDFWQGKAGRIDLADVYLMRIFGPFDVPLPVR